MNVVGGFEARENSVDFIKNIEETYSIKFPPVFRAFVHSFKINSLQSMEGHDIIHPNEELGFGELDYDIEELAQFYKEGSDANIKKSMLPFAFSGIHSGGFCVCLEGDECDAIFIDDETAEGRFVKIGDNILDFFSQLQFVKY